MSYKTLAGMPKYLRRLHKKGVIKLSIPPWELIEATYALKYEPEPDETDDGNKEANEVKEQEGRSIDTVDWKEIGVSVHNSLEEKLEAKFVVNVPPLTEEVPPTPPLNIVQKSKLPMNRVKPKKDKPIIIKVSNIKKMNEKTASPIQQVIPSEEAENLDQNTSSAAEPVILSEEAENIDENTSTAAEPVIPSEEAETIDESTSAAVEPVILSEEAEKREQNDSNPAVDTTLNFTCMIVMENQRGDNVESWMLTGKGTSQADAYEQIVSQLYTVAEEKEKAGK